MNRLHNNTYLIIESDFTAYNTKRIYGICCTYRYSSGLVNHCLRRAYTTEQSRNDAMRDLSPWYKENINLLFFVDVQYITERNWPNHPLYNEVNKETEENRVKDKIIYKKELQDMIKTDPCKALINNYYNLTYWQRLWCKIQCYVNRNTKRKV